VGWGKVGVWESPEVELRGWGTCSASDPRLERYDPNLFAASIGSLCASRAPTLVLCAKRDRCM